MYMLIFLGYKTWDKITRLQNSNYLALINIMEELSKIVKSIYIPLAIYENSASLLTPDIDILVNFLLIGT